MRSSRVTERRNGPLGLRDDDDDDDDDWDRVSGRACSSALGLGPLNFAMDQRY